MQHIHIKELMLKSGVTFGTSGARGLVSGMTDLVCMAYTKAFLQHLEESSLETAPRLLLIGGDRRPSSPRIMQAVGQAARHAGYTVKNAGLVPSPALALWGMQLGAATVMVTGSHIPDDRNGLKFTTKAGEITKADEEGIVRQVLTELPAVDQHGMLVSAEPLPAVDHSASELYVQRYVSAFGSQALCGVRLGVYGHSAVGRELLVRLYQELGADVVPLGFSDTFVPVDTEAIRPIDDQLAADWAKESKFDAILSTDGDSDRPLCSDEYGVWLRGDVTGVLTARFLGARAVALPISCNTALEKSGWFEHVERTRIGSPYVIAGLLALQERGATAVVGYEANGGFFTQTELLIPRGSEPSATLPPLPTRDAVLVHLSVILLAKQQSCSVSQLRALLPARFTESGRDQKFDAPRSASLLSLLRSMERSRLSDTLALGPVVSVDETDGLRLGFESDEILHFRASGNAPELRCYAEAGSSTRARQLVSWGLALARSMTET